MKNPAVPKAFGTRYLIVRSYYFHIRSLSDSKSQMTVDVYSFIKFELHPFLIVHRT